MNKGDGLLEKTGTQKVFKISVNLTYDRLHLSLFIYIQQKIISKKLEAFWGNLVRGIQSASINREA